MGRAEFVVVCGSMCGDSRATAGVIIGVLRGESELLRRGDAGVNAVGVGDAHRGHRTAPIRLTPQSPPPYTSRVVLGRAELGRVPYAEVAQR